MWRIIALVDNKAWRGRRLWRDIYIPRQCWSVSFSMPDLSPVMPNFKQKFRLSGKKRHSIRAIVCLPARKQTQRYSNSAIATATSSRQKEQQLSKARGEPNPLIMRPIQRSCVATPMSLQRRKQDRRKSPFPRMRNALHSLGPIVLRKYWNEPNEFERKGESIFQQGSSWLLTSHRFFMIDRKREDHELKEEFKVLGSTANVSWQECSKFHLRLIR